MHDRDSIDHRGTAVAVEGLHHRFGDVTALDDVWLEVPVGSFVSLVGPSGCGKSTLLRVLAGVLSPTAGLATVYGQSTIDRPGLVGYMPQRDLLLPWRRALDNACLGADIAGADRAASRARARQLFERFGLAGFERAWPPQLSGGMRQRLALLRTYLIGSDVLLLDEPFGALDAITRRQLYRWLQELWLSEGQDRSMSALFVTHDVEEALFLSDVVHVMSARPGRMVETVKVDAPRPRDPAILTSLPFVEMKAALLEALETVV
jgi:ABC-type nitrate/sulfonate/bicarbonate transport system ATPase subunit